MTVRNGALVLAAARAALGRRSHQKSGEGLAPAWQREQLGLHASDSNGLQIDRESKCGHFKDLLVKTPLELRSRRHR